MNIKKIALLILAVAMLLSCFAGCTAVDNSESSQPKSSVPSEPSQEQPIVIDPVAREAVIMTALAYLGRGTRIQYDDSRLVDDSAFYTYRWQSGVRLSPEEYTSQYVGYTNCSAFTGDVYLAALGVDLGTNTTGALSSIADVRRVFNYVPTGTETAEEMAAVEAEFRATLQPADIIVIRYNGGKSGQGHAMLYVGSEVLENVEGYRGAAAEGTDENGKPKEEGYVYDIIHSTGSSYKYKDRYEKYEQYGSIQITSADSLFDSTHARYVFSKLQRIAIIRPLNKFEGAVPQHTLNRMEYMYGVVAEKLSTHTVSMTVNPGDTMTFTFSVTNKNEKEITLPITDVLPANTAFVSSENCTVNGTSLSWSMTIPAGATQTVSYTVKVNEDAQIGEYVCSTEGTVGGIPVNCPCVYIGRTVTEAEKKALNNAIKNLNNSKLSNLELANAIYEKALGAKELLPNDYAALIDGIYVKNNSYHYLAEEGAYYKMVAPGLFGGRYVRQRNSGNEAQLLKHEEIRTRLLTEEPLIAGDILVADTDIQYKQQVYYLYTGEALFNLSTGTTLTKEESTSVLTACLSYSRFVVLRPSLVMDSGK